MKRYKYIDGVKTVKYPVLELYLERMNENWESKVFGITFPIYGILMIFILVLFPVGDSSWTALILHGILSIWFIVSYILMTRRRVKDNKKGLKDAIYRDSKKSF